MTFRAFRTYGDVMPSMLGWIERKKRLRGRGQVASISDDQRGFNRLYRSLLENDPMHIQLSIREIANGVLVSTGSGDVYDPTNPGESFFPHMEAVYDAVPDLLRDAHARSITLKAREEEAMRQKHVEHEAEQDRIYYRNQPSGAVRAPLDRTWATSGANERGYTHAAEACPERLPEEAAALAQPLASDTFETNTFNEDADPRPEPPITYDDEASEPVQPIPVEPLGANGETLIGTPIEDEETAEYSGSGAKTFEIGKGFMTGEDAPQDLEERN